MPSKITRFSRNYVIAMGRTLLLSFGREFRLYASFIVINDYGMGFELVV
jgi:hypothetical protein